MVQINNHYPSLLKRTLQFVIALSLVSLLLFFSLYQNSIFNLICHRFPLFSHALERKYMFLICNGILAILAKSSVSNGTSSKDGVSQPLMTNFYVLKSADNDHEVALEIYTDEILEDVALMYQEEQQEEENSMLVLGEKARKEGESECLMYVEEDENNAFFEERQNEENSIKDLTDEGVEGCYDEEEEEAVVESNEELTSIEEMNRRFEEFIRKMKEEIRIEAQRQLISV